MAENFSIADAINFRIANLILLAPGILIALVFHEVAHGLVANKLGDPTAKEQGRLTLNPLKHLDPAGTLLFFIVSFGWAKPVPVVPRHFRNPRRDMALVSLAGPATNFVLAVCFGLLLKFQLVDGLTAQFVMRAVVVNIFLGVFNLVPIPPLDGSRLVAAILPPALHERYEALEGYGIAIILAVIFLAPGGLGTVVSPFLEFFQRLELL